MRTRKMLFLLTASLVIVALLPLTAAAGPAAKAAVEQALLDRLAAEGSANFFVKMALDADTSAGARMDVKAARQYVWDVLNQVAGATQSPVLDYCAKQGLDCTPMVINNSVFVRGGRLEAAQELASLPGVAYLRLEQITVLDPIVETKGPVLEGGPAWGITDTHADDVWAGGYKGAGIKVANIDTGVQWNHPALDQAYACPTDPGNAACWRDPSNTCGGTPCDNNGHGTHTMGTMVADDDPSLEYMAGMAPDATWIACKGCESNSCSDSSLTACATWILAPGGNTANAPDVVNNSWGGGGGDAWYRTYVQQWVNAHIFPAFSAGNSGSGCSTLGSPGDYQESFGSAAHDSGRAIASFSSRGPSAAFGHEPYTKPNISAPGVSVCSTIPGSSWSCGYSGTSMASPHSAGAVALAWSACPALLGQIDLTFQILQDTADAPPAGNCGAPPDGEGNYTFGYGYLNALAAVGECQGGIGTLNGTVTDAVTGLPVSGAAVSVQPATEGAGIDAVTDPSGYYSMALLPGAYDVTASHTDYYAQTATGVVVAAGQTATQDFALQPLPPATNLLCDDMESGSGNWSHNAAVGTDDWAIVTTSYHSATHAWWTSDTVTVSDKRLWNSAPLAIPAGVDSAGLKFWHRYGIETGWDGMVIEISTDGGGTWSDLGSRITQNGYNATLYSSGNPLGGRAAWSGTAAWNEVIVNLSAYIGQTVQVRFRIGTDSSVGSTGWWIDDVCFFTRGGGGCTPVSGAGFSWSPASPEIGQLVTFTGLAQGTAPISYSWDFGDGAGGSGATATHTYATAGTYSVQMTAVNACGSQTVTHDVTVTCTAPYNAAFSWSPASPETGQLVTFTGSASGLAPISYSWDFGDGGTGSGATATHTYGTAGAYSVQMTAANACGSQTVTHEVTVQAPPQNSLHINTHTLTSSVKRGVYTFTATVKVHTQAHVAAVGVTVSGTWTLPGGGTAGGSAVTKANGIAKITYTTTVRGTYTFCVDGLAKVGYVYNSAANEAGACQSRTVQ